MTLVNSSLFKKPVFDRVEFYLHLLKAYLEMGAAERKVSSGFEPTQKGKTRDDDKMIDEPIQILLLRL